MTGEKKRRKRTGLKTRHYKSEDERGAVRASTKTY